MPIAYRRIVEVRQGQGDRFVRLVNAYANAVFACGVDAWITAGPCSGRRNRFWIDETYLDRQSAAEARRATSFDTLWLPAIIRHVKEYTLEIVEPGGQPGGNPPGCRFEGQ
jgi:hypothetical protein